MAEQKEEPPKSQQVIPQSLVTEAHVMAALKADKGSEAILMSWSVEDFTKPGDNYMCVVTSIKVNFSLHHQNLEVVYIAKLNPCSVFSDLKGFMSTVFQKEARFYLNLVPELNASLNNIGERPLHFPKCIYGNLENDKEIIFFEDLRVAGFKMFDRQQGLDVAHTTLILEELARLHAASHLLQDNTPDQDLTTRHPFLLKDLFNYNEDAEESMRPVISQYLDKSIEILKKVEGYEASISWIQTVVPKLVQVLQEQLSIDKYSVVCHGDCWNNNFLFSYDDNGSPVEVMLLDLQMTRWASPATDLNYLLYSSLTGEVRKANLEAFLTIYHTTFTTIMEAVGKDTIFTQKELLKEFRDKNVIGIIFAMMAVPLILLDPKNVPDISKGGLGLESMMEDIRITTLETVDTNPLLQPRFLALFDEMMETGLIPM